MQYFGKLMSYFNEETTTDHRRTSIQNKRKENDNRFDSLKEIELARIKQQAIKSSGEISEYCHVLRNRSQNGIVSGYSYLTAKLYYDIASANYEYYRQGLVHDNLLSVREYLKKCINQFDQKNPRANHINIVKDARYFLDSVCVLENPSPIDSNLNNGENQELIEHITSDVQMKCGCVSVNHEKNLKKNFKIK
jgi:hypothetical protein